MPAHAVQSASERLVLVSAEAILVQGVKVRICHGAPNHDAVAAKLGRALTLLKSVRPGLAKRSMQSIRRVVVWRGNSEYWSSTHACAVDAKLFGDDYPDYVLASTLVHEATHARLDRADLQWREDLRARVEQICTNQQIDFAKLVPGTERYRAWLQDGLTIPWWTKEGIRARRLAAMQEAELPT